MPFNLKDTRSFLLSKKNKLNNKQIADICMGTGGVLYYLANIKKGLSSTQIIEDLAFNRDGILFKEFDNLLASLFEDAKPYIEILKIMSSYRYGISQEKLIEKSKYLSRGGIGIRPNAIAGTWRYIPKAGSKDSGAQIDLLFDRMDEVITICKIKYTSKPFVIDKQYAKNILNKQEIFIKKPKQKNRS